MDKNIEDFDENWQAKVPCQHACVQKLTLLGSAICSQYNRDLDDN